MATTIFQLAHGRVITAADTGNFGQLGDGGHGMSPGAIVFEFQPNTSWVGSLSIQARVGGGPLSKQDNAIPVNFAPVPFRKIYLNGVAWDYSMSTPAEIVTGVTGASIIQIPANGLTVAVLVTCSAGAGLVAVRTIEGCCAP